MCFDIFNPIGCLSNIFSSHSLSADSVALAGSILYLTTNITHQFIISELFTLRYHFCLQYFQTTLAARREKLMNNSSLHHYSDSSQTYARTLSFYTYRIAASVMESQPVRPTGNCPPTHVTHSPGDVHSTNSIILFGRMAVT